MVRKGLAPDKGPAVCVKVHTAHAYFGSIGGSKEGWFLWDYFCQAGRPVAQASNQAAEGIEAVVYKGIDADAVTLSLVLRPLQGAKQAGGTGNSNGDEPKTALNW